MRKQVNLINTQFIIFAGARFTANGSWSFHKRFVEI